METIQPAQPFHFLQYSGEMGRLTRDFNWSKTSIGPSDTWPQSLRTTVGNLLRSRFPMFLWWGPGLIQFYNDAYRPSLGNEGKHPTALGQRGEDCWPEIWPVIYPLIQQVLQTGEPAWMEDQLIPIYRNGSLEDVYWTFSYSLVLNDDDAPGGILVTCMETTEAVKGRMRLQDSEARFRNAMEQAPLAIGVTTGADLNFDMINPPMLQLIHKKSKSDVMGKKLLDVLPELTGQPVFDIILNVLQTGESFSGTGIEVELVKEGTLQGGFFNITYNRIINENGEPSVLHMATDVTAQVLARRKIEESEAKLRSILNSAPTAMGVFVGPDLILENANQLMIELMAAGPDIAGKSFRQLLAGLVEEEQKFLQIIDGVRTTGAPFEAQEVEVYFKVEKKTRYFNINFIPLTDGSGAIYAVLDVSVDVTEQVESRKKTEESEAKLKSLISAAPIGIGLFIGRDLVIESPNQEFIEIVGKGADIAGKRLTDVMPELIEHGQPYLKILDDVFTSGKMYQSLGDPVNVVRKGVLQSGFYNIYYVPLFDAEGNVYGIMDIATDVTEQVFSRQKLAQSEKNFRNMILQAPVAMCILKGPQYVVEIANERMFEVWGKTADDVINKPIFEGLPEAREQGLEDLLLQVYTTGETFSAFEMPVKLPRNGKIETTYLNFVYEPFYDADENITGVIAVAIEVTEQVLSRHKIEEVVAQRTKELAGANETLQTINKELQRSNANLEEFAHAASHDLKEPIRKITFFTHQLRDHLASHLKEAEQRSFSRIENATERMGNLIDDLLLYSHVSQRPHETEAVDLNEKVKRVMEDLELDIAEKGAVIHIARLPVVQGYRRQLQQLFQNLISNALKYSKAEAPPRIDITAGLVTEEGQGYHLIKVQDNGIGFEQQYAEKIFQMFSRLHGRQEYSGTGVGLSIVKKVVENHNGFIRVESAVGEGAVFKIYLPV